MTSKVPSALRRLPVGILKVFGIVTLMQLVILTNRVHESTLMRAASTSAPPHVAEVAPPQRERPPSTIHVCLCTDDANMQPVVVALRSIMVATSHPERLVFHLVTLPELALVFRMHLRVNVPGATIEVHHDESLLARIGELIPQSRNPEVRKVLASPFNFAPFYLQEFINDKMDRSVERFIYVDTDTVILGDLRELYDMDLRGRPCAAVKYCWQVYKEYFNLKALKEFGFSHFDPEECIVNRGLIVIDIEAWRQKKITEKIEEWMARYNRSKKELWMSGMSQPPWLLALDSDYLEIGEEWNCNSLGRSEMSLKESAILRAGGFSDEALREIGATVTKKGKVHPHVINCSGSAKLLHFNGNIKPWQIHVGETWVLPICMVPESLHKYMWTWNATVNGQMFVNCAEVWLMYSGSATKRQLEAIGRRKRHELNKANGGLRAKLQPPNATKEEPAPTVHVCLATDDADMRPITVAIDTAVAAAPAGTDLLFHLITAPHLVEFFRLRLRVHLPRARVQVHHNAELEGRISKFIDYRESSGAHKALASPLNFAPFYFDEYLRHENGTKWEAIKRVIYMDTDTVVLGNLQELQSIDLRGHPCAAVRQCSTQYEDVFDMGQLRSFGEATYEPSACTANRGLLVIDVARWTARNITGKIEEWMARYGSTAKDLWRGGISQPPWLLAVGGDYLELSSEWNCNGLGRTRMEPKEAAALRDDGFTDKHLARLGAGREGDRLAPYVVSCSASAKLLHYDGALKPWSLDASDGRALPVCSAPTRLLKSEWTWKRRLKNQTFVMCAELWLIYSGAGPDKLREVGAARIAALKKKKKVLEMPFRKWDHVVAAETIIGLDGKVIAREGRDGLVFGPPQKSSSKYIMVIWSSRAHGHNRFMNVRPLEVPVASLRAAPLDQADPNATA